MNGRDFCYDPSWAGNPSTPALARVGNDGNPSSAFPLKKCQGDCDSNRDCESGLICLQRNAQSSRTVPGCSGRANDGTDFCVDPRDVGSPNASPPPAPTQSNSGQLVKVGDNGRPSSVFPLKRCQGDCDRDSDCERPLICFQRNSDQTSVPGCGQASSRDSVDYCIRPLDMAPTSGSFRLKLYWEQGYFWQEETVERKWCMECDGTGCDFDDSIHVQRCGSSNTWFVFENLSNGTTQIRVAGKNLCLELVSNNAIRLRNCDASKDRQKFRPGLGNFGGDKFELQTIVNTGCLSQEHHPKSDEIVRRYDCAVPRGRGDRTNFWNRY